MERKHFRISALAGMILGVLGAGPAVGDPVRVPGTKVSLQPPSGFSAAKRFPGFERADLNASIMVTEMPAPAAEMMKAMTKEGLASKGMTLVASENEKIGGREALLVHVAQSAAGLEFLKWMLITGDQKTAVMIVATYPKGAEGAVGEAVKASLLSTAWNPDAPTDSFEGLQFRVTPTPKLKIAARVSNMLMLTESGTPGPHGPKEPIYLVGSSVTETQITDLRSFSEARARRVAQVKDVENINGRDIKLGGLAAYELEADAKDAKTGTAIRLYQVVAPEGRHYFIVQSLVAAERAAEMIPEFQRVTETFRMKDAK